MIVRESGMGELALSLKPPKWARKAVRSLIGGGNVQATVSTPAGPIPAADAAKGWLQAAKDALANTRITIGKGGPASTPDAFVRESIPGGYLTLAAVGLGLLFVISRRGRRKS